MYDVIVVGAGVIGCAVARYLSQYEGKMAVLERGYDVSTGASGANSGIVHAGYDAVPGSDKARVNVKGASMFPQMCRELGVPYGQPGALVLAFDEEDMTTLEALLARSKENGVEGCKIIGRDDILRMEPNINRDVVAALHVPTSGLVSPYELTHALANAAKAGGVDFLLEHEVLGAEPAHEGWTLHTTKGAFHTRAFVNCAGGLADRLHNPISTRQVRLIPRRGQYYLLDREDNLRFTMTIFQVPTKMGKGVLISPTTHGNLIVGPTAEDIDDPLDARTTAEGLRDVLEKAAKTWPGIDTRTVITNFSGVRAHEVSGDFIVGAVEGAKDGAFEAIGIESPGLTAAPAIGAELGEWVAYSLKLRKKPYPPQVAPKPKAFSHMSAQERVEAHRKDPDYGRIVCRCETVTEAEVRTAIREPVGARTIDGVKRRTRAGMGRCQGGFCMPRVGEILAEELGLQPEQVTKFGGGSYILAGTLKEVASKEDVHERS